MPIAVLSNGLLARAAHPLSNNAKINVTIVAESRLAQQCETTGGVDTHADFHVAAVIDHLGRATSPSRRSGDSDRLPVPDDKRNPRLPGSEPTGNRAGKSSLTAIFSASTDLGSDQAYLAIGSRWPGMPLTWRNAIVRKIAVDPQEEMV